VNVEFSNGRGYFNSFADGIITVVEVREAHTLTQTQVSGAYALVALGRFHFEGAQPADNAQA
jgi:hypothetical protein